MPGKNASSALQIRERFHRSFAEVSGLARTLPEDAVVALAREVLVRLAAPSVDAQAQRVKTSDILPLCNALLSCDPDAAAQLVEGYFARGATVQDLYLNYLGPASRQLGDWWNKDKVSFAEVTIGTGRIYAIMRSISSHLSPPDKVRSKTALFASIPDETHTLGIRMAADLFRQEGWKIDLAIDESHEELVELIRISSCRMIGLSAGGIHAIDKLARLVIAIRMCKPDAVVVISGNIVAEAAETINLMDVDGAEVSFAKAQETLNRLWDRTA